jgi:hypothetical protein
MRVTPPWDLKILEIVVMEVIMPIAEKNARAYLQHAEENLRGWYLRKRDS